MFNRLRKLWRLSQKDEESIGKLLDLNEEELKFIPDEGLKAEFFGPGTQEDFDNMLKEEKGFKKFFNKIMK